MQTLLIIIISGSFITIIFAMYFYKQYLVRKQKSFLSKIVKIRTAEIEEKNIELLKQTETLNKLNAKLLQRNEVIEKQTKELQNQKTELEISLKRLNEINTVISERQKIIEEQSEELIAQKEELRAANEHLTELDLMKNKFFSIIVHDLKNPLTTILGFSELLNVNQKKLTDEKKLKYSEKIHNASKIINELIENLLQWSRIQTNNFIFEPSVFNLKNLVIQSVTILKDVIENKNITVEFENTVYYNVYADRNMIYSVIRNLLSNALKYSLPNNKVKVSCEKNEKMVQLSIIDYGVGIPENELPRIFRIDNNYVREGTNGELGTGLGLILSKEYILKNKGEIWVESIENKGTNISFTIPRSEYIFNSLDGSNKHKLLTISKKDILVVEDEPTNFYLLKNFLKPIKANIYWAKNGIEAVNMVIKNNIYNIGIVFMDIKMPEMDGFEAIKQIRKIDKELPVIAQSAYIEDLDYEQGVEKGFTDILHKPIKREIVLDFINKYIT